MHSKKNGRPVDKMTTFVENTESALSSGAEEMAYKILKNKRDWFMKTLQRGRLVAEAEVATGGTQMAK